MKRHISAKILNNECPGSGTACGDSGKTEQGDYHSTHLETLTIDDVTCPACLHALRAFLFKLLAAVDTAFVHRWTE